MPQHINENARSPRLAAMLDLEAGGEGLCTEDELRQILGYRLSGPVPGAPVSQTIAAALADPDPPLELLERVREFSQSCRNDRESQVPPEVATLLYYASLAAAWVRHGHRAAPLNDDSF